MVAKKKKNKKGRKQNRHTQNLEITEKNLEKQTRPNANRERSF